MICFALYLFVKIDLARLGRIQVGQKFYEMDECLDYK